MPNLRPPDPPFQARKFSTGERNVQEWGPIDLTGAKDCSYNLNQAFADLADNDDIELVLPPGRYRISQGLLCRDAAPRIRGYGVRTVIVADGTDFDWLTYGAGVDSGQVGPSGWVRDLKFESRSKAEAPSGFKAGLKADGATFVDLSNIWVDYAPIGFDFVNNCFGIHLYRCRTTFGRCRIAERLSGDRTGMVFASGSDINHTDCWFAGKDAAVWMERNGGGYNYFGGQMLSGVGLSAPDDNHGTLTVNKNLEEVGTVGGRMSAAFFGTSFESVSKGWNVRIFGTGTDPNGCQLLFSAVRYTGGVGGSAIGVLKLTDGYNDTIQWNCCAINGVYSNAVPLSINISANGAARPQFIEFGTQNFATFNGVGPAVEPSINTTNMLAVSNVQRAFGSTSFHWVTPGMILHGTDTVLQYSKNIVSPSWTNVNS